MEEHKEIINSKNKKLLNLVDCLIFLQIKLILAQHQPHNADSVPSLGGIARSIKYYGKARKFVQQLYLQQKEEIKHGKKKEKVYGEIYNELLKYLELIANLSRDNLYDWIIKQIREIYRAKK